MTRLRHVASDALTIERRRQGKGFVYISPDGKPVRDKEFRARARHLAIPPAWREVRIAPHPRAHIQALGLDAAGRQQYLYHPDWETRRTRTKQRHLSALAETLPRLRRRVRQDLEAEAGSKTLALAIAVALIDRTAMRVGRERYLAANGTRGAGTLFTRDVTVTGDEVRLAFPAKSGKRSSYVFADARLAAAIARIKTIPGQRLLMFINGDNQPRPVRTEEINGYLREITGAPVSAKDFRTLHASALAGEALARLERAASPTARKRQLAGVIERVASFLQNTPAICRKSYVAPCLIELFDTGRLGELWAAGDENSGGLRQREFRLARLLATQLG
jgi:DNA topoisomerase-1